MLYGGPLFVYASACILYGGPLFEYPPVLKSTKAHVCRLALQSPKLSSYDSLFRNQRDVGLSQWDVDKQSYFRKAARNTNQYRMLINEELSDAAVH